MDVSDVKASLRSLSNDDLLDLLESVSDEVKRRNNDMGPDSGSGAEGVAEGVASLIEVLSELGKSKE
jgi:hypothetical protein